MTSMRKSPSILRNNPFSKMNEKSDDVELNVCPFKLKWLIGTNVEADLVNLTTENRCMIAYACSHIVILYDYASKDTMSLQGHQNAVRSLSASRDGKWLLSADYDEDSVCIIWDTETRVPICSLFNPHGKSSLTATRLSPDAKYLVTVGNEEAQIVKFWLWTYGKDEADATAELGETTADRVKKISFNDEYQREFLLTLGRNVVFVSWKKSTSLDTHRPKIPEKTRCVTGSFNDSCYACKSLRAMTVTSNGFVLVWGETMQNSRSKNEAETRDKKGLVKSVRLQRKKLTRIENQNEIIAVGNISGQIYFYDDELRLLYWCRNCGLDAIVSISFDRKSDLVGPEIPPSESSIFESETFEEMNIFDTSDEEEISGSTRVEKNYSRMKNPDELMENKKERFENSRINKKSMKRISHEDSSMKDTKNVTSSIVSIDIDYLSDDSKGNIREPIDCTLQRGSFVMPNFFVMSASGKIARFDMKKLRCRFIMHSAEGCITAIAARPKSDYMATGNSMGVVSLYKYTTRRCMVTKKTPAIPNMTKLLSDESGKLDTTYVTRPKIHESLIGVSTLRFSPAKDGILACGLTSGIIWILHPDTLEPIDLNPYKHSSSTITDIIFTSDGEYIAYSDDAFTVGVFKRNNIMSQKKNNLWIFLGKYHSHCMPIREILFLKPAVGKILPRLLSIGEDENLVEYDLENSGPYPEPGLKILNISRVENQCSPLCMAIYPEFGHETFLIAANSEYKFRLINDYTKTVRKTILGPTLSDPVQRMHITERMQVDRKNGEYMIFRTSKEIGLLMLPFDGNPYKFVAMIGHPKKIKSMTISGCGKYLFTLGENECGVFTWKINYRSVRTMDSLGGKGLTPFYSLIDGDSEGWLVNEMKDLFYYAQILQQGENTTAPRIVSDKVSIMQLPNLMRAVGFYPTNNELEIMMEEASYKYYAETGRLVEEITFQDFVKLYVNHRPAFGITKHRVKNAFNVFARANDLDNPILTSKQFLRVLFGHGVKSNHDSNTEEKLYGEPLSKEEAYTYLRRLVPQDEDSASYSSSRDDKELKTELNFDFLPLNISYKSFTDEILGIKDPEISQLDNHDIGSLS